MNNYRWVPLLAAIVLAAVVGVMAYNAGIAHGIQQSGKIVVPPGPVPYPYPYMWHPWGFGGFFFAPLFFIFIWILIFRGLFWHRRGWHRGRCGYGLDEWHRQAHERMSGGGTPQQ